MNEEIFNKYYNLLLTNIEDLIFMKTSHDDLLGCCFSHSFGLSLTIDWFSPEFIQFYSYIDERNSKINYNHREKMGVLCLRYLALLHHKNPPFTIKIVKNQYVEIKYKDIVVFNGYDQQVHNSEINEFDELQGYLTLSEDSFFKNKIKSSEYNVDLRSFMQKIYYNGTIMVFVVK